MRKENKRILSLLLLFLTVVSGVDKGTEEDLISSSRDRQRKGV